MVQGKPGGTVHISNGMPDVEALMQQWPLEVEQKLHTMKLPDSTLVTPFALLHIVCVCVRRCVCFSNIFPGTQLMGSNPDRFGAARFSTLVTPFALLHIVCVCVCVCVRVHSIHMHPSIHSSTHALTRAYTWVQHQSPTKCCCSLWQPCRPVIPATTAACLTAACTVNVSTLLSCKCKDNLPRLVAQSLATTISSMVKHTNSHPQALRLSMTHSYPQALSLSMTHSHPQALSLSISSSAQIEHDSLISSSTQFEHDSLISSSAQFEHDSLIRAPTLHSLTS